MMWWCWGRGGSGQPGTPVPTAACDVGGSSVACSTARVAARPNRAFVSLTAGGAHACGLTADGSAFCWGSNTCGRLGDGSTTSCDTPVRVAIGLEFASVALGTGSEADGLVRTRVAGGLAFTGLAAGFRHTCGHASTGAVYCWGSGRTGQLGRRPGGSSSVPVKVSGQP